MRISSILACVGCLVAAVALAQSPVALSIQIGNPGPLVATNFGVFSFEMGGLQYDEPGWVNYGYFFNPTNTQLITLFQNLGVKSIRVGGNSGDDFIPTDAEIDSFFQFAAAANVQVVFALDLKTGTPSQDAAEAQYIWDNYATNLFCFAIGNEPEGSGANAQMTNFSSYISTWQTFASAVLAAAPGAVLGGPDNESGGISYAPEFAQAEQGNTNVVSIQYHFKPGGSANGQTTRQLIAGELSTNLDTETYPICYSEIGAMAQSYGYTYRLSEFDPYVAPSNNVEGEDMPYSAALYALDLLHWWAANGCLGVHYHTGPGMGFLSAFYYDQNGNLQVYPVCYGMAAFTVGGYGNVEPLTMTNTAALNLTAYAVGGGTNLFVTVINRENGSGARNAAVTIAPNGFVAAKVSALYLVQSNGDVTATNGVTLGGAAISGTAPWQGQWTALGSLTNGQCVVSVPAASAAIVRIQASSLFIPPVIVTNLPPQVFLTPGGTCQYFVGAEDGLPLNYQWYQGATPLAGQTNTTYMVTAGNVGTRSSYFVVVTNIYASVTSSVSTLTVIAPATNSFATTIEQFCPVGYWPMHEVEAPAPGDIETNYGSLGLLGTGYYPDWAASPAVALKRQHSGPMAANSDPDTAVNFTHDETSGNVEFTNGLFVPYTSSFTTLNPPFTVECWFYPTNLSTGVDVWSQNGDEGLNAGAEGGAAGYVNGMRLVWVNSTFVIYAFDNLDNPYTLPNLNNERIVGQNLTDYAFASNQWYHLVVTCDSNLNISLFTNGAQVASSVSGVGRYSPDYWTPLSIGEGYGDERSIAGDISEFAVYTNALQPGDISYHYAVGTNPHPQTNYFTVVENDNPVIYLRMNSFAYSPPPANTWPELLNLGSVGINGVYSPGTVPGILAGPISSSGVPFGGVTNDASLFSGVSSFADAGYAPPYNPTGSNANFTVTAIFRGNPCDNRIQSIAGRGTNSWQLTITTNGCIVFNAGNGNKAAGGTGQAAGDLSTVGVYNDGNWHQVAAVNNTNVISIYVDGILDTNGTPNGISATNLIPGNTSDVMIGSDPDYTNNPAGVGWSFAGQICDVAFFTNALSAGQVQALYLSATTPLPETLAVTNAGNSQMQLDWNYGTMQTATNVTGPYNDIPNASSPYTIQTTNSQQFYRVREN